MSADPTRTPARRTFDIPGSRFIDAGFDAIDDDRRRRCPPVWWRHLRRNSLGNEVAICAGVDWIGDAPPASYRPDDPTRILPIDEALRLRQIAQPGPGVILE